MPAYRIDWNELSAIEPTLDEVRHHAPALAIAYNHPRNASLLGHKVKLAEAEVVEHYELLYSQGARSFLLLCNGALAGDADVRGITRGAGEFAFLIALPDAQGKGLGTRFATMVHALAFAQGIERMYASMVPENVASRRVFEKLGYVEDTAREYGDEGDIVMMIDRATFRARHDLADITIAMR